MNGGQGELGRQQHVFRAGGKISQKNQLRGFSHTVFLNSAPFFEAKKYSERKHAYMSDVTPPYMHKRKTPELSKCFWLPFLLPDVAKTTLFL